MSQHYSNPRRADDPHALPDVETFRVDARGYVNGEPFVLPHESGEPAMGLATPGWYYWFCFPGCMPDSEPMGPFRTEDEALADAREGLTDDDDDDAACVCCEGPIHAGSDPGTYCGACQHAGCNLQPAGTGCVRGDA